MPTSAEYARQLQEVLTDKRSRGAFGEAQMMLLVRNVMPEGAFAEQHMLSNGTREHLAVPPTI